MAYKSNKITISFYVVSLYCYNLNTNYYTFQQYIFTLLIKKFLFLLLTYTTPTTSLYNFIKNLYKH